MKHVFSILCCAALAVSLLPASALAAATDPSEGSNDEQINNVEPVEDADSTGTAAGSETEIVRSSQPQYLMSKRLGDGMVLLKWRCPPNVVFKDYQIYSSTHKTKGFKKVRANKKPHTSSIACSIILKNQKRTGKIYYKVRGVKTIKGTKVVSQFSNVARALGSDDR